MLSTTDLRKLLTTRAPAACEALAQSHSFCGLFFNADMLRGPGIWNYGDEARRRLDVFLDTEGWTARKSPLCRTAMFRGDLPPTPMVVDGHTFYIPVFAYLFAGALEHDWSKLMFASWREHMVMTDTCLEASTGVHLARLLPAMVPKGFFQANGSFTDFPA